MDPANGVVDVQGQRVGSQAIYNCDDGFAESGPLVRVCGQNGEWDGTDTECIDISTIMCPPLPNPANGGVTILRNTFEGGALYSCNDGFCPVGSTIRICTVRSEWSGEPPTCQSKYVLNYISKVI